MIGFSVPKAYLLRGFRSSDKKSIAEENVSDDVEDVSDGLEDVSESAPMVAFSSESNDVDIKFSQSDVPDI